MNPYIPYSPFGGNGLYDEQVWKSAQQANASLEQFRLHQQAINNQQAMCNQAAIASREVWQHAARALADRSAFGGHVSHTPSGDDLPRLGAGGSRLGALWLRVRLLFVDTRNRRRPVAPLLLRSGALRRVA